VLSVRRRKPGYDRTQRRLGEPVGQAPLQHTLPAAPHTCNDDNDAIASPRSCEQKTLQGMPAADLAMAVEIETGAYLELPAPHTFLISAFSERRITVFERQARGVQIVAPRR
jgi:hypothetical protein